MKHEDCSSCTAHEMARQTLYAQDYTLGEALAQAMDKRLSGNWGR